MSSKTKKDILADKHAARIELIEFLTQDKIDQWSSDLSCLASIARDGFAGFDAMADYDLAQSARDAGLDSLDPRVASLVNSMAS